MTTQFLIHVSISPVQLQRSQWSKNIPKKNGKKIKLCICGLQFSYVTNDSGGPILEVPNLKQLFKLKHLILSKDQFSVGHTQMWSSHYCKSLLKILAIFSKDVSVSPTDAKAMNTQIAWCLQVHQSKRNTLITWHDSNNILDIWYQTWIIQI